MNMERTAWAAKNTFDSDRDPCHYKTFGLLEQSAQPLIDGLADVNVIEPEILKPIEI